MRLKGKITRQTPLVMAREEGERGREGEEERERERERERGRGRKSEMNVRDRSRFASLDIKLFQEKQKRN